MALNHGFPVPPVRSGYDQDGKCIADVIVETDGERVRCRLSPTDYFEAAVYLKDKAIIQR